MLICPSQVYHTPLEDTDFWGSGTSDDAPSSSSGHSGHMAYYYPTSTRYQQFSAALACYNSINLSVVPPAPLAVASLPAGTSPESANGTARHPDRPYHLLGSDRHGGVPAPKRPLPEMPLSNRKIQRYNNKVKNNNIAAQNAASVGGPPIALLQRIPADLPAFVPPGQTQIPPSMRQRLDEILAESDSEDERVVVPRARAGCAELGTRPQLCANGSTPDNVLTSVVFVSTERSTVTKATLAALTAGTAPPDTGGLFSGSNVKWAMRI